MKTKNYERREMSTTLWLKFSKKTTKTGVLKGELDNGMSGYHEIFVVTSIVSNKTCRNKQNRKILNYAIVNDFMA